MASEQRSILRRIRATSILIPSYEKTVSNSRVEERREWTAIREGETAVRASRRVRQRERAFHVLIGRWKGEIEESGRNLRTTGSQTPELLLIAMA